MVTRATSVPNAINNISNKGGKKPQTTPKPPKPLVRSRSFNNGVRKPSPGKRLVRSTEQSKTQEKNAPVLMRSRGNEIGSADTLEIVATRSTGSEPSTPEDNVNVVVRVRPLCEKEKKGGHGMVLQFPGNGQIVCEGKALGNSGGPNIKVFTYNVVFEPGATQDDILQYSGVKRLIEMAIEGFSCTAFCYGQTGSGKTHTLTGPPALFHGKPNPKDERHGLIFRSFVYLFQRIQEQKDMHFILKASFLEIYNEKVIDLLNPGSARKPLAVRWSKKSRGFYVENLFTVDCEELDDLLAVLEEGMRNRSVGSHQMNEHSSRSHTMLTVHITSEQQAEGGVFLSKQGKINFVDLAGSEMTKKTQSEGTTLEEANNINKSLMVLGYCIASLSDSKKRSGHIPYRDSKLTKLLADSLAGNGVTLMIACVSPAYSNYAETLNTLRYASRAKRIRTKPIIIMDPREALILSLKRDINALQIENEHLKSALNLQNETIALKVLNDSNHDRAVIPEAPKVDLERLAELEASELAELVKLYMVENKALRNENSEFYTTREMVLRDHEVVCRENERLLKKLEDVNSVCVRSPLISARPAISSSPTTDGSSEVWTNPLQEDTMNNVNSKSTINVPEKQMFSRSPSIPEAIQKEMEIRRIGDNILNMANTLQRQSALNRFSNKEALANSKLNQKNENAQQQNGYMPDMII